MSNYFFGLPATRPGRWSVGLTIAFAVMYTLNSFMFMPNSSDDSWLQVIPPFASIVMLLCGLAAGIVGIFALTLRNERSWLVWTTIWPAVVVVFLLVGENLSSP